MMFVENRELGTWIVGYINRLRLYKGKGAAASINLRAWQEKIIRDIFSMVDAETGLRQYTEVFIAMPKKNGKSTLIAAVITVLLCADGERGGEVYSAATTRDQAALVFETAANMIEADPHLRKLCKINRTRKRIIYLPTQSFYQALSADTDYTDGIDASAVIYDELHRAKNSKLYDLLKSSMASREQPLFITITTAGSDKATVCGDVWDYAVKVRDGVIKNDRFYPCIFAATADDDWKDPAVWKKANPALGDFLSMSQMEEACRRASEQPSMLASFKRYRLNIWTEADEAWLPLSKWDACRKEFPLAELAGRLCYAGVDLSSVSDLTTIQLWFPDEEGEGGIVLSFFFCPEANLMARQESTGVPYFAWAQEGHLQATPGNVVDQQAVRVKLGELKEVYDVRAVLIDRWNSTGLQTDLLADGFEVIQFGQGFASMNAPSKELEKLVMGVKLRHNGHPVMRWNVSNAVAEIDPAGNIKPSKKRAKGKIDGVVGLVEAIGGALQLGESGGGAYEDGAMVL